MGGLPNTSYRDIAIKGNDLIVATYGRGLWVLDDISMLRQLTPAVASEPAHLFKPGDAVRVRRNVNANTPFPPEVPHALNPPSGVIIDYTLAVGARGRDHARCARCVGCGRQAHVERAGSAGGGGGEADDAELLGGAAARAAGEGRRESRELGSCDTTRRRCSRTRSSSRRIRG